MERIVGRCWLKWLKRYSRIKSVVGFIHLVFLFYKNSPYLSFINMNLYIYIYIYIYIPVSRSMYILFQRILLALCRAPFICTAAFKIFIKTLTKSYRNYPFPFPPRSLAFPHVALVIPFPNSIPLSSSTSSFPFPANPAINHFLPRSFKVFFGQPISITIM